MLAETARSQGRGLLSYLHPAFMGPAVGMSLFGGLLAREFAAVPGTVHAFAVGLALYTAHLKDGYVDGHLRGEETPALSAITNRQSIWVASTGFAVVLGALWLTVGFVSVLWVVPLWILAMLHAPYLDKNPLGGTVGYPVGIALAIGGGFFVQAHRLPVRIIGVSLVFLVLLSAVKISTDREDYEFDRSIEKRTVPVALGTDTANEISIGVFLLASALVVGLIAVGTFPPLTTIAAVFPLCAACVSAFVSRDRSIRLQMLLMYPFAATLFLTLR
ncbi:MULTISPECIES: UbiA family prenyltransferase [unclassified Haladaptatus]|uniref:UbiA family prenyltransferase n=1 Tax=unclassified Haladaptatus TaxID=2622732 RepID=UPI00209C1A35|nr:MULTISPECIES: UbiA family prenyltransferase [unclassified Haladaptatus]MCO8243752.1 UbiA family prenyltransferase [Haladaptatus sp. AB643]MCO8256693.1 UbiA family prenyltransferase [Haladaptatus sp. AB618]